MRLALAQLNPTVGDLEAAADAISSAAAHARDAGADLFSTTELAVCGYPPKDLLLRDGFVQACVHAADDIAARAPRGLTLVIGSPWPLDGGGVANSLLVYRDGARIDRYDKRLLPTYDVFDEDRYFTPGDRPVTIDVAGTRVGLAICEDLWKGEDAGFAARYRRAPDPVADLARAGSRILLTPSASPFVLGKGARHRQILRSHALKHGLWVAAVNQVGGNDDLIFDGHAAVLSPDGAVRAAAPGFTACTLLTDIPPGGLPPGPPVPDPLDMAPPQRLLLDALTLGTRDYLAKTGFSTAVIGLSGGIDSAVTAAIAARAIGSENVIGLAMPSRYSSPHSIEDAHDLAARLALRCIDIPIEPPVRAAAAALNAAFDLLARPRLGAALPDLTEENLQSRIRGLIAMGISNRTGAIVLTTGNKSELAVGYCTLYGDMNGGLAVLSDVPKTLVYTLAEHLNTHWQTLGFERPPIPERSITKPPSAELRPDQTDQDSLPPYDLLDQIVELHIEQRRGLAGIIAATSRHPAASPDLIARIVGMIDLAEYKRKQLAIGLKVTGVAFGQGRRMPIAQRWREPV